MIRGPGTLRARRGCSRSRTASSRAASTASCAMSMRRASATSSSCAYTRRAISMRSAHRFPKQAMYASIPIPWSAPGRSKPLCVRPVRLSRRLTWSWVATWSRRFAGSGLPGTTPKAPAQWDSAFLTTSPWAPPTLWPRTGSRESRSWISTCITATVPRRSSRTKTGYCSAPRSSTRSTPSLRCGKIRRIVSACRWKRPRKATSFGPR